MKTIHTTSAETSSTSRALVHSFMMAAGIMTAIICSIVLLSETKSQRADATGFSIIKASASITDQVVHVKDATVVSVLAEVVKF